MDFLKRHARDFRRAPYLFMTIYGANVAGLFWNLGTALQFVFGMIAQSPREIASAAFNIASPCSFLFFGHKNWGIVSGGVLGTIGTMLAVYPQLATGELGSVFGFAAFCVFVSLSIFSVPLMRMFVSSRNVFLRAVLGHPRRSNGLGTFVFTRLPIIYESIAHNRWHLATVFAVWGLGDLAFSFSKADIEPKPKRSRPAW